MIHNWFNNLSGQKSRRAAGGHVKLDILRPRGRRALQATEIYSRKYYGERISPLVKEAKKKLNRRPTRSESMKIIRDCTIEAYKNESREVKEEVEAERLAQQEDDDAGDSTDSEKADGGDGSHSAVRHAAKRQVYVNCI